MSDSIQVSIEQGLFIITLNMPERRNALSTAVAIELLSVVQGAREDPEVRAVLLRGAGGTFCVGGDVKGMVDPKAVPLSIESKNALMHRTMEVGRTLHEMMKPVVCAIDGAAAGAGLSLALACDFRVVGESAKITTSFAKVAVAGDYGGIFFLTKMLGSAKARELCLLCPVLSGREAHAIGLVTRLVPDAEVQEAAHELALSLANGPTISLGYLKANINDAEDGTFEAYLSAEAQRQTRCLQTEDHKEAALAFVEKRSPQFKGR